ncbi:hypothetical protein BDZ89DRAFT_791366 [Hymenopellis radicata]|nr:hypothetical protein BDZ89DRAFT_791366 [Hymenopellis radicata]
MRPRMPHVPVGLNSDRDAGTRSFALSSYHPRLPHLSLATKSRLADAALRTSFDGTALRMSTLSVCFVVSCHATPSRMATTMLVRRQQSWTRPPSSRDDKDNVLQHNQHDDNTSSAITETLTTRMRMRARAR